MLMLWPNYHHDMSEGEDVYDDFWAHECELPLGAGS